MRDDLIGRLQADAEAAKEGALMSDIVGESLVSLVKRAAAEIARLRAEREWQPIETAPADTAVLTYGFGYEVAHFNTLLKAWVACWDHRRIRTPDKWQPLPTPPVNRPEMTAGEENA